MNPIRSQVEHVPYGVNKASLIDLFQSFNNQMHLIDKRLTAKVDHEISRGFYDHYNEVNTAMTSIVELKKQMK